MIKELNFEYKNETVSNVFIADTFFERFIGYMFQKEPHHKAIMIKPCNSIHTFFMRFNIDALFIDENMKVIKKVENLKPGKVIMPVRGAKTVLEAETGVLRNIKIGDKIYI